MQTFLQIFHGCPGEYHSSEWPPSALGLDFVSSADAEDIPHEKFYLRYCQQTLSLIAP